MLELHIFGGLEGESCLLKLPNGDWGLIDCFTHSTDDSSKNPVVAFLRSQKVAKLLFVCMSHHHADHYLGLRQILEEFKAESFWLPAAMTSSNLISIVEEREISAGTKALSSGRGGDRELTKLLRLVKDLHRSKKIEVLRISIGTDVVKSSWPAGFEMRAIAPSARQVEAFERRLSNCFDQNRVFQFQMDERDVNRISIGFLIKWNGVSIVLGSDIERGGWLDLKRYDFDQVKGATVVKVSHHGSSNGYCEELWQQFGGSKQGCAAIITPLRRHGLPTMRALSHISTFAKVYTVSKSGVRDQALFRNYTPLQQLGILAGSIKLPPASDADGRITVGIDANGLVDVSTHGDAAIIS